MNTEEKELKIGDFLIADSRYHGLRKVEILRFTKTTMVVMDYTETKIRLPFRTGSSAIGDSGFGSTYYRLPTSELLNKLDKQTVLRYVKKFDFDSLTLEKLNALAEILR